MRGVFAAHKVNLTRQIDARGGQRRRAPGKIALIVGKCCACGPPAARGEISIESEKATGIIGVSQ